MKKICGKVTHIVAHQTVLGQPPQLKIYPRCGSPSSRTGAGDQPGEASLHCSNCKRFIRWISANELKTLAQKGGKG